MYKTKIDIIQYKINKRKIIKETTITNGNIWKKDGQRKIYERKNIKGSTEEKDSTYSSKKSCRKLQTKNNITPTEKIILSDAPT